MELSCPLGMRALSRKENLSCFGVLSHIINPIFTNLVRSRLLDIGLLFFGVLMDRDEVEVHKHAENELGQYPAILTSRLVNNPCLFKCRGF